VVPDLTGLPLEEAVEKLESLDLEGRFAGSLFNMDYPEGSVVSQQPEGGRRVKIGRMVNLLTSSGKRKVNVPNLLGRPSIQAEAVLAAEGLFLGVVIADFVPELDPGIILTQNPLPGEEAEAGSSVDITVSGTEEPQISAEAIGEGPGEGEGTGNEEKEEGGFWPW
jgi:beta-lactam-binding protein with PASTA domain